MFWEKYTYSQIKSKVFESLSKNTNYRTENIIGIPGTFLDTDIFYDDAPFLKDDEHKLCLSSQQAYLLTI